jgi:hypothetical protein
MVGAKRPPELINLSTAEQRSLSNKMADSGGSRKLEKRDPPQKGEPVPVIAKHFSHLGCKISSFTYVNLQIPGDPPPF